MPSSKSSLWTQKVKLKSCIHGVINLDYKSKKKKKIWGLLILLFSAVNRIIISLSRQAKVYLMWLHFEICFCLMMKKYLLKRTLLEKCPYSELFWFVFSRIRTEWLPIRTLLPSESICRANKTHVLFLFALLKDIFVFSTNLRWSLIISPIWNRKFRIN